MAELDVALADWLKPFVEKLGHKKRRQMHPVYISGRRVTLFETWPREAVTAVFRQTVHSRLSTRPWPGVDGFEFVLRSG
jgi:hypothetical protein